MKLPESWVETRLGDVLERVDTKIDPQTSSISSHFYIGLEHIESHTGHLLREAGDKTEGGDILSIKTQFKAGDILYGKLRPNLNKVYLSEQDGICSTDIWALRATRVIIPEFAVHYLRSPAVHVRASQLAAGANLPRVPASSFDRIPIVLPTILEQQRIVDLMRQAELIVESRSTIQKAIGDTINEHYAKLFGDVFANEKSWPIAKLGTISNVVRGSSPRPQGDPRLFGGPVPRLMVSDLSRDGLWVNAKTDSLTEEGAKFSRAMDSQSVVMAVSGAPGLTAILSNDACIHDGFVGLRNLDQNLLPEYVAYTLNLLKAKNDQQAVGAVFRNLTTDQVRAIAIAIPPLELQKKFREFLLQIKTLQRDIASSNEQLQKLLDAIRIEAFSGELTAGWREINSVEITAAIADRDELLHKKSSKPYKADELDNQTQPVTSKSVRAKTRDAASPQRLKRVEHGRPARHWLINELSEFQHAIWTMLRDEWRNLVIVDDPEAFNDFCTNPQTTWPIEHFNASPNRIRRTLEQLAALGLIAKVSVPRQNAATLQTEYLTAFRPLREDENSRLRDAAMLKNALNTNELPTSYSAE
ncbi:restriction endonuclease subunit S [Methylococcaceae bacterium WWC4]|nr:restriction endonuclease subunit S [Methylococcaceae bacterium WWC4]